MFDGDALHSIQMLLECRSLVRYFTQQYKNICAKGIWEEDSSVSASCDAFSQRCIDLCEICLDRLQFDRSQTLLKCRGGAVERLKNFNVASLDEDAENSN